MLADLNRVRRRHQPEHRSAPLPAEEAPYRAHALQIVLVPAAIDDGNEALGQFVDVGDERDAADERIEAGLHQGPQPRRDKQPKKENAAEDDEEAEEVGACVRGGEIEPEQDDKPADQAVGSGVSLEQLRNPSRDDDGDEDCRQPRRRGQGRDDGDPGRMAVVRTILLLVLPPVAVLVAYAISTTGTSSEGGRVPIPGEGVVEP